MPRRVPKPKPVHTLLVKLYDLVELVSAVVVITEILGVFCATAHEVGDVVHPVAAIGTIFFMVTKV